MGQYRTNTSIRQQIQGYACLHVYLYVCISALLVSFTQRLSFKVSFKPLTKCGARLVSINYFIIMRESEGTPDLANHCWIIAGIIAGYVI